MISKIHYLCHKILRNSQMNKISIYALTFFLSLSSVTVYSQKNNKQVIFTNEQGSDIFYHTIERGQTVYAIATMYGVSVEDIYRLNPESKEGIKPVLR